MTHLDRSINLPPAIDRAVTWLIRRWAEDPWRPAVEIPARDGTLTPLLILEMTADEARAAVNHVSGQAVEAIQRYLVTLDADDEWTAATLLFLASLCRGVLLAHAGEAEPADGLRIPLDLLQPGCN